MIKIVNVSGLSDWELQALYEADDLANRVLQSLELEKTIILARRFDGSIGFESTPDSPSTVLSRYRSGDLGLTVSVYTPSWWHRFSSEVAHENPDGSIAFNRRFYDSMDAADRVNTIFHEAGHALGYTHDYFRTAARPYSEPYQVGDIAEKVARFLLVQPTAPKVQAEVIV